jgi:hypothetical protein
MSGFFCKSGRHRKYSPGVCATCRAESRRRAQRKYRSTEKAKAARARRAKTEADLEAQRQRNARLKAARAELRRLEVEAEIFTRKGGNGHTLQYIVERGGRVVPYSKKARRQLWRLALRTASAPESTPAPLPPTLKALAAERGWESSLCRDGDLWVACEKGELISRGETAAVARTGDPEAARAVESIPGTRRLASNGEAVFFVSSIALEAVASVLLPRLTTTEQKES